MSNIGLGLIEPDSVSVVKLNRQVIRQMELLHLFKKLKKVLHVFNADRKVLTQ